MCLKWFKKQKVDFQEVKLQCPRCNITMDKIRKNGVIIDVCKKCHGMWLDDNEIEKLVQFGKKQKNTKKTIRGKK